MPEPHRDPYDWRPRSDSLLNDHLRRTGLQTLARQDAQAYADITRVRYLVNLVEAALSDEDIPWDIARRVLERVIYGGTPNPADIEQRMQLMDERIKEASHGLFRPDASR
jgi:hypothetical protein